MLICILKEEPDSARFSAALLAAIGKLRMSAANYLETAIVLDANDRTMLSDKLDNLIDYLKIELVPVTPDHAKLAREAYRMFGRGSHPAKLNFGDCFAYALAKAENAPLLFKGNDFAQTDVIRAI